MADPATKQDASAGEVWHSLETIMSFTTQMLRVVSQVAFLLNLSRTTGGPIFAFLAVLQPLVSTLSNQNFWNSSK